MTRVEFLKGMMGLVGARTEERGPEICNMDEIRDAIFAMHYDLGRRLDELERTVEALRTQCGTTDPTGTQVPGKESGLQSPAPGTSVAGGGAIRPCGP